MGKTKEEKMSFRSWLVRLLAIASVSHVRSETVAFMPGDEGYPFSEGLARISDRRYWRDTGDNAEVEVFQKYAYIDKRGVLVVPFLYEKAGDFSGELAFVAARRSADRTKLLYGYINKRGEESIPLQFEGAKQFAEGVAPVQINGSWGYVDKSGRIVIQPNFDNAMPFNDGLAAVESEKGWGFIDIKGAMVIPYGLGTESGFREGMALANLGSGQKGVMDRTGRLRVQFPDTVIPFGEFGGGLIRLRSVQLDPESQRPIYGFGDKEGRITISPKYQTVYAFGEGLAAAKLGDKYGFINASGEVVIPFNFTISEGEFLGGPPVFSEGVAFVKGGYIDRSGNWVLKTYDHELNSR